MDYTFEKGKFTELEFEQAVIALFKEQGYEYVSGETIHRTFDEVLLEDDLRAHLLGRYAKAGLTEVELETIVNKLSNISYSPLYLGNREAFWLVNEGFDLMREDKSKTAVHIDYIDFDHPERNIFKVVNQFTVEGSHQRRPDVLVFINGIPVVIWEFKSAIDENTTIHDAWEQIYRRYSRDIPNLLKYCFLSVISDGANNRMGTVFTTYEYYYAWNKANHTDSVANGISSLFTLIKGAFAKDRLCSILRDFIFFPDDSKTDKAIVCRYPQFFATRALLDSIKAHLRPKGDGKGGTYFGTTGCGKTYTMMFLARQMALRDNETFRNPTVIIIVDREDLDSQTAELFVTAKRFLREQDVRSIENRNDLAQTLCGRPSGGVYITTIQKFCEDTGLLSDRNNIICLSDEAHRTQTSVGGKLKISEEGVFTTYGFAKYLRDSFPNATYCGFSGTPIDETMAVFGKMVDECYTMQESTDDGITVRITYEPRLAHVVLSDEEAKKIEKYYEQCAEEGSTEEQIEESKQAMSSMTAIISHPDRLRKLACDMVEHYESMCGMKPMVVQKAMIVCIDRRVAFSLLKEILAIRPEWGEARKAEDESKLTKEQLNNLVALPKINLVATQGVNDEKDLYETCGSKEYRQMLDKQFKNNDSNFKIAIVVDMWITGFDVPSLAVMYIDKPLQRHTLIQTISRVNRVFEGKKKGLIVDYIGIRNKMMQAMKQYGKEGLGGGKGGDPIEELKTSLEIFRNYLKMIDELLTGFDASDFHRGAPLQRLLCLNRAVEYVQTLKDRETRFMNMSKVLKSAYEICFPSGELTDEETAKAQFYLAIRSIIYKQTHGNAPDAETMNSVVEEMVRQAIDCTGVENILEKGTEMELLSEENLEELKKINMPFTKFNALVKLLKRAINSYRKVNQVKAMEFDKMLREVVEEYNNRDNFLATNAVITDVVDCLSDKIVEIVKKLEADRDSFKKMGITFEEKAFYDILIRVRDEHQFEYPEDKCVELAKEIKALVDDKSQYADWSTRGNVKASLIIDLYRLLKDNKYPYEWTQEVFEKVMEQAENFKKYNG